MPLVQRARVHSHQEKLGAALEDLNRRSASTRATWPCC